MVHTPNVKPLPIRHRRYTLIVLILLFVGALPFLYLYATGYRFSFDGDSPFVSTGGLYVAANRTGASIYIDNELVRETRTFRKAFYAQGLMPGIHRVYVQKPGHHTWVKELPVYPHIVTEAMAFNMPKVPNVRIISPWRTRTGATVLATSSRLHASSTNSVVVSPVTRPSYVPDTEYASLLALFATTTAPRAADVASERLSSDVASFAGESTMQFATTTKLVDDVLLYEESGNVYARWVGSREQMPYYYCAKEFETSLNRIAPSTEDAALSEGLIGPIPSVPADVVCEPTIAIDRNNETVRAFYFLPGSTDLVLMARETGIYVTEIDNRAWQNTQPLLLGEGLDLRVENATVYVYDGELIYQVVIES